jgi:hypothetical protein
VSEEEEPTRNSSGVDLDMEAQGWQPELFVD